MARSSTRPARRRPPRPSIALRWLAVGALVLCGLLYVRPLGTYLDRRAAVADRAAEVRTLRVERDRLARRLRFSKSDAALAREARRLGYVRPGERLFIVKGIPRWRATHQRGGTIGRGGR
jgi:cell division protein FtsB